MWAIVTDTESMLALDIQSGLESTFYWHSTYSLFLLKVWYVRGSSGHRAAGRASADHSWYDVLVADQLLP